MCTSSLWNCNFAGVHTACGVLDRSGGFDAATAADRLRVMRVAVYRTRDKRSHRAGHEQAYQANQPEVSSCAR